ncbi:methyl-accepting chemotaxis protein [Arcobacter sp. s6]|uniref:methyl-accepting chemotaxis protein n=1 Tax=Arcobacter sp. s6 TaxID=3230363 RepID=UPI0034A04399
MLITLKRLSLENKMKIIAGFPLIFIIILSLSVLIDSYKEKSKLESIKQIVLLNTKISLLLHETQKERGASAGYLGSKGSEFKENLLKQRTITDSKINELNTFLNTFSFENYSSNNKIFIDKATNDLLNIKDIRSKVDSLEIESKKAIEYYTNMNADFLSFIANTSLIAQNSELISNINAYYNFLMAKERAGIERAVGAATFANETFAPGMYPKFLSLVNEQDLFLKIFNIYGSQYGEFAKEKMSNPIFAEVQRMRDILLSYSENTDIKFDIESKYWFDTITKKINILKEIDDYVIQNINTKIDTFISEETKRMYIIALGLIFIILFTVVFVQFFIGSINRVLKKINDGIEQFMKYLNKEINEIEYIKVGTKGSLGYLANMVNKNIDTINGSLEKDLLCVGEATITLDKVQKGYYGCRVNSVAANPQVRILAKNINSMLDNQQRVINEILKVLNEYTNYNYLSVIDTTGIEGESKQMVEGINALGQAITNMLIENKTNGQTLDEGSTQLLNNVDQLNKASNDAAARLEETAAAVEEITSNIASSTQNIAQMAKNANELTVSANEGEKLATQTVSSMDDINTQVTAINEAITVIDQIAFQTNILSLNAAVEAATAGEAGRGFAVVAAEVRNLAARSAEAANEIKTLVENATLKSKQGKDVAALMINGYHNLNDNITNTLSLISKVENASKEQKFGIEQISDAINSLDKQTQINANIANHTNTIAVETSQLAKNVVEATNTKEFRGKYK